MKKQGIIIFNIILITVLLVVFSFAWITDESVEYGKYAHLYYPDDNLFILANNMEASLHIKTNEAGADIDGYVNYKDKPIFTAEKFAPGEHLEYRLDIVNYSKIKTTVKISFGGITTDSSELAEMLIFGTTRFNGFAADSAPTHVTTTVSDRLTNNTFVFFDKMDLPVVSGAVTSMKISIYWYVFFDRSATNESATKYFNIPSLFIMSI